MEIRVGDRFQRSFSISEEMIKGFAGSTGDNNPIHLNEDFAKSSMFHARIAHGFLVGSLISAVLGNDFPGHGTIYISQYMRFLKPVYIGDSIQVVVEVIEITEKKWLRMKTECINQNNNPVIIGEAVIIAPKDCKIISVY
jgi:3-hydroxybutyryl-CoA dehydratase